MTDPAARFAYLAQVVDLTDRDRALVRAARGDLRQRMPVIVDRIVAVILGDPAMARHFAHDGPPDPSVIGRHLQGWLEGFVALARDDGLATWMDRVGRMHQAQDGDPRVQVDRLQLNALMAVLADAVLAETSRLDRPVELRFEIARAFSKLLWIQADLLTRHT